MAELLERLLIYGRHGELGRAWKRRRNHARMEAIAARRSCAREVAWAREDCRRRSSVPESMIVNVNKVLVRDPPRVILHCNGA